MSPRWSQRCTSRCTDRALTGWLRSCGCNANRTSGRWRCVCQRHDAISADALARKGVRPLHRMAGAWMRTFRACTRTPPSSSLTRKPHFATASNVASRANHAGGINPTGFNPSVRSSSSPRAIRSEALASLSVRNSPSRAVRPKARTESIAWRGKPTSSWRSPCRKISAPFAAHCCIQSTKSACWCNGHWPCQLGTTSNAGVTSWCLHKSQSARTGLANAGVTS